MSAAKTATERVAKLRAGLKDKGVKRWELSPPPHPEDQPAIKAFAAKLARKRAKLARHEPANDSLTGARAKTPDAGRCL